MNNLDTIKRIFGLIAEKRLGAALSLFQNLLVEGLQEAHIIVCHAQRPSLAFKQGDGLRHIVAYRADAQNSHIAAVNIVLSVLFSAGFICQSRIL